MHCSGVLRGKRKGIWAWGERVYWEEEEMCMEPGDGRGMEQKEGWREEGMACMRMGARPDTVQTLQPGGHTAREKLSTVNYCPMQFLG